jgi:hypothetical protein
VLRFADGDVELRELDAEPREAFLATREDGRETLLYLHHHTPDGEPVYVEPR